MAEKKTAENGRSKTTAHNKTGGISKAAIDKEKKPLSRSTSKAGAKTVAAPKSSASKKSSGTKSRQKKTSVSKKQKIFIPAILGIFIGGGLTLALMAWLIPPVRDMLQIFRSGTEVTTGESRSSALSKTDGTDLASAIEDKNTIAEKNVPLQTNGTNVEKAKTEAYTQRQYLPQETVLQKSSAKTSVKESLATAAKANSPHNRENQLADTQVASGKKDTGMQKESPLAATIPQAAAGTKLVFVFDDGGQNMSQLEHFVTLPFPITVSVLPRLSHSAEAARRVRLSGNEVLLHQPMQALNLNIKPGDGAILPDMSAEEIVATMKANLAEVGPVAGMNNHEGSLISEDEFKMASVLAMAKESGIFYLDSRTTSKSRVAQAAMEVGIGYYERNVFLDNTKKRDDILREIRRGIDIANKKGSAIMIGHIWSADILPDILRELHPILISKGYSFSTVSNSGAMVM